MGQVNVNTPGDSGGGSAAAIVLVVVVLIVLVLLVLWLTGAFGTRTTSEIFQIMGV
ncbi:MAG: hypothetical protein IVW55_00130 [Chloroflexi bacterium]|nr:hypothetical protein [Chloroflexota bacterium]